MNVSLSFASPARKQNTTTTTNRGNPMTQPPSPPLATGLKYAEQSTLVFVFWGKGAGGNMAPHILPENLISICINHRKQIKLPHFYASLHNFGPSAIPSR